MKVLSIVRQLVYRQGVGLWRIALVSIVGMSLLDLSYPTTPTLSEVLAQAKVAARASQLRDFDKPIWDYARAANADRFAVCYFVGTRAKLASTFHLAVKDLRHGTWREATLDLNNGRLYGDAWLDRGSCTGINMVGGRMFPFLQYGPSAGTTLQFDSHLRLQHAFYGWGKAWLGNGLVIYDHSRPHSPYEQSNLWLFDSATGQQKKIFPVAPYDAIRIRYQAWLTELNDGQWYAKNDVSRATVPTEVGDVLVNEQARRLVFNAAYSAPGLPGAEAIYVYTFAPHWRTFYFREFASRKPLTRAELEEFLVRSHR